MEDSVSGILGGQSPRKKVAALYQCVCCHRSVLLDHPLGQPPDYGNGAYSGPFPPPCQPADANPTRMSAHLWAFRGLVEPGSVEGARVIPAPMGIEREPEVTETTAEAASSEASEEASAEALEIAVPSHLRPKTRSAPNADCVVHPLDKLRAKYFDGWASWGFDLYICHRSLDTSWLDRIEGADLYATLLMSSAVRYTEARDLMQRANDIADALQAVPRDVPLPDADLTSTGPTAIATSLGELFKRVYAHNVSHAKVTKILCQKRPALIPIIDSYVSSMLRPSREGTLLGSLRVFQELMTYKDTAGPDNIHSLKQLASRFTDELWWFLRTLGVSEPHPQLGAVRILDNLLWFDGGGFQHWPCDFEKDPHSGRIVRRGSRFSRPVWEWWGVS